MATGGDSTLSMGHIEDLSEMITDKNMTTVAINYLGIEYETLENLRSKNRADVTGFNRDVLVKWRNKTQGTTQVSIPVLLSNNTLCQKGRAQRQLDRSEFKIISFM